MVGELQDCAKAPQGSAAHTGALKCIAWIQGPLERSGTSGALLAREADRRIPAASPAGRPFHHENVPLHDKGQTREQRAERRDCFSRKPPPPPPQGPAFHPWHNATPGTGPDRAQRARKGLRARGGRQSAAPSLLPAAPRAQRSGAAPRSPTEMCPGSRSRPPPPPRPGQPAAGPDPQARAENGKAEEQFSGLHLPAGKEMHQGVSLAHPRRLHPGERKDAPGASAPHSRRRSKRGSA